MNFNPSDLGLYHLRRVALHLEENEPTRFHDWVRICDRALVYRNKKIGMILKRPNYIDNPDVPKDVCVPTVQLNKRGWVVQPIVKKVDRKNAVQLIRKQLGDIKCDLHHLNVGWYEGKPVMFDW